MPKDIVVQPLLPQRWSKKDIEKDLLEGQMLTNLQLSYDLLPMKLRLCSLFLAVFPEKTIIRKKYLIYWWIGEGFVTKTSTMTAEEAGEKAFKELIDNGLIQPCYKTSVSPSISGCTVNPWIRRMLISTAKKSDFFDLSPEGKVTRDHHTSHRAIMGRNLGPDQDDGRKGELSTVYNMNERYLRFNQEYFTKIENLKVLQLGRWQKSPFHHIEIEDAKFLEKLGTQKHLKYLSLRGISRVASLPSSVSGCRNIEILDLRACHNLEKLPSDIGSLSKLTHFIVSECYLLDGLPKGLEKISSLEVLKGFVVGHWRKNPCSLASLSKLEALRKLSITIGTESIQESVSNGKKKSSPSQTTSSIFETLSKINSLRILTVTWQTKRSTDESEQQIGDQSVSISLPLLEKLDLRCFPSRKLPVWFSPGNLRKLERLYIRGGKLESLVPVANSEKKWEIRILRLGYLENLQLISPSFDVMKTEFPEMMYFERTKCQIGHADVAWKVEDGWEALGEKLKNDANIN